ncbi:MAG: hypothetical protein CMP12_13975 [Zunongwangia sp.]|uniref:TonB C-terminal domain-containing protein n=3 Tax=Zunongwangia profunda TaxID=398743 RepID=D5BB63_ZUNPS|nr:conserved hypothetical protein [Zunongwangia profunda SM-A87]MAC64259.1 hypothetical protein [Flavobacteriaceae bacterium]MAC65723.1 hypothetical protein [Flavobacteriaceae bacterium]MAO36983.1 hypothetical protein [Zunongwangia sp.]MAS70459.1 hypothetical protein [Zunongwangia sp.]
MKLQAEDLMKRRVLPVLALLIISCNFETKKISSEEVLEQESKSLNWKEVDEYPAFEECQQETELTAARNCFETAVANNIYAYLEKQQPVVSKSIDDTIYIYLEITKKGKPEIDSISAIDSTVTNQLPKIENWLRESIDSLPKIYPASKRGIPVSTAFKMPIVIKAE